MHFIRLCKRMLLGAFELSWAGAISITLGHAIFSYIGLRAAGETHLVGTFIDFIYYYIATGSSVGYGDMSPMSPAGRLFVALFVIPVAISLFALLLGKAILSFQSAMRSIMQGFGDYSHRTGHLVIVGHSERRTRRLIAETRKSLHGKDIVLVARQEQSGIDEDLVFVSAQSLASSEALIRAGVQGADSIVIFADSDDEALGAALAVTALKPVGHVVVYFDDPDHARLIEAHCPEVECVVSSTIATVSRAVSDPGLGHVLARLSSSLVDATLHSTTLGGNAPISAALLSREMLAKHGAALVGYRVAGEKDPVLSLGASKQISPGDAVFYVADERIADSSEFSSGALEV